MDALESESVEILRETAACARNPVMLYSAGKDSSVMLHLARKAFYPAVPPFPLLHIDTTWKFSEIYRHRDEAARANGMRLIVHRNEEGLKAGVTPFSQGISHYTQVMKTEALRQALDLHGFDAVLCGARRDEGQCSAKERIFSVASPGHHREPRAQSPEIRALYNTRIVPGESLRVFPLANWTELDIWRYVHAERIEIVSLYLARDRPVVERAGMLIVADDERLPLNHGERPTIRKVRFRSLGCYPLTGATESAADSLQGIVAETSSDRFSERRGRLVDDDQTALADNRKREPRR